MSKGQFDKLVPDEYQDYLDVFDRDKADELPPHRQYDHKLEFIDDADKRNMKPPRRDLFCKP